MSLKDIKPVADKSLVEATKFYASIGKLLDATAAGLKLKLPRKSDVRKELKEPLPTMRVPAASARRLYLAAPTLAVGCPHRRTFPHRARFRLVPSAASASVISRPAGALERE
jgi:hypothetical protein